MSLTELESRALLGVRFLALILAFAGGLWLVLNLAGSVLTFNPTYWLFFVQSELLQPFLVMAAGAALRLFSRPISRWLCRGIE